MGEISHYLFMVSPLDYYRKARAVLKEDGEPIDLYTKNGRAITQEELESNWEKNRLSVNKSLQSSSLMSNHVYSYFEMNSISWNPAKTALWLAGVASYAYCKDHSRLLTVALTLLGVIGLRKIFQQPSQPRIESLSREEIRALSQSPILREESSNSESEAYDSNSISEREESTSSDEKSPSEKEEIIPLERMTDSREGRYRDDDLLGVLDHPVPNQARYRR